MPAVLIRIMPAVGFLLLAGCDGSIDGSLPGQPAVPGPGPAPTVDAGPAACAPTGQQVPKLLRLSNFEYRQMVTDLLGVPVDPALFTRWTPVAQVYGFDTMSETRVDAQALEEQLATAEQLAALVKATPALTAHCPAVRPVQTPACPLKATYSAADDFSDAQSRDCWTYLDSAGALMSFDNTRASWRKLPEETALLWRNGAHPGGTVDVVRRWQVPVDGRVTLSGFFNDADPGGGDGVLVTIRRDGTQVYTRDVPNGGQAPFSLTLDVTRGAQLDFVVNRKTNANYDTTAFAASLAFTPTPRKDAWTWSGCVEPLVARLASRAYRRPVRPDELEDARVLFESSRSGAAAAGFAEPVDEALTAVLQALFLSPNFVFKPELVPGGLDAPERQYGVASRLGLFLRGGLADEATWTLAGTGGLGTPAAVRAEAERLLAQDGDRFALHFGGQWLDFREGGPQHALVESMRDESREVFEAVLRDGLGPEKLLRPGFTIVDPALATHYGFSSMGGPSPWRLPTEQRGGVLSQALFLARTGSGSEFRRPIHRGLWVLTRLMCQSLPHIDPATLQEINMSFDAIDRNRPLPEQMALHRDSSTRCGGCHSLIDPVGLALEKYDPVGNWRDTYANGAPIVTDLEFEGVRVHDPLELAGAIEGSPRYRECVATKLLTFALNRGPKEDELCVAQRLGQPLDGSKPDLGAMTVEALLKGLELTEVSP